MLAVLLTLVFVDCLKGALLLFGTKSYIIICEIVLPLIILVLWSFYKADLFNRFYICNSFSKQMILFIILELHFHNLRGLYSL